MNTTRRLFLQGSAAAVPAAMLPVTLAVAATAPDLATATMSPEDPALLALGAQIEPLRLKFKAASSALAAAIMRYDELRPEVPAEIVLANEDRYRFGDCAEDERDLNGERIWIDEPNPVCRKILSGRALRAHIILHDLPRHTKEGRKLRRLARIATEYERAKQMALKTSNYEDCEVDAREVAYDLESLVRAIRKIEPRTQEGLLIYARALRAYEPAEIASGHHVGMSGHLLGSGLAAAVVRLATQANLPV